MFLPLDFSRAALLLSAFCFLTFLFGFPMAAPFDMRTLNPPQIEAVRHKDGPLLILAGAGTGKTRVITCRIAWMISQGVPPEQILAVTFTNKASREMRERVAGMLGRDTAARVTVGTFHSFGAGLLRRHIGRLGYSAKFGIASQSYQVGLVKEIMGGVGAVGEGYDAEKFQARISLAKNALRTPDDEFAAAAFPVDRKFAEVYDLYRRRMKMMDLLDFDDLLVLVLELWTRFPDVLEKHREQFRYLMVDEYQDTNPVQFQIVRTLAGPRANLCVVGDDDQSIYAWRGATVDNILRFEANFDGMPVKVIRLEQNYRSTNNILEAANHVIKNNPLRHGKKLWSGKEKGEPLVCVRVTDDEAEGKLVADIARELQQTKKHAWHDLAVLYRSNHQSRIFELALRQAKIPYTIVGGKSFYERKEVLDGISLLQAAWNPRDDLALLRVLNVPPRGVGEKSVERLKELQRVSSLPLQQILGENEFLHDLQSATAVEAVRSFRACLEKHRELFSQPGGLAGKVESLFQESGYLDGLLKLYKQREDAMGRRENLLEFVNAAAEFEQREGAAAGLGAFLERFTLMDMNDKDEATSREDRGVTLMTVHAAKGLEFPAVVIVGLEHGLFPHEMAVDEGHTDEERRLFYVAITRAQKTLYLAHCERRKVRGNPVRRRPSEFLDELPTELIEHHTPETVFKPASREDVSDFLAQMKARLAKK
jgi:superfamily I DNA/RNA helicase